MINNKPRRGEIWFVDLDPKVGREQAKKRPCLVISSNIFNQGYSELHIIVPLTSKDKNNPLHIAVEPPEGGVKQKSFILCEQIRTVSGKRFSGSVLGKIHDKTLESVEDVIKTLLDIY